MSDLQTEIKKATEIKTDAVTALRGKIRGDIILPGDAHYEMARKVYNAMIDKRPAMIIRCIDVADVSTAINFSHEQRLEVAVRGGAHNGPGFGTVEGGLVIDLSRMRGIRVNPDEKTVRVEGGAVWGDVDHATYPFGLAVPAGFLSSTGIGGLTLGGGSGYLTRRFGLTIDNLLSVDMVLADGCFVTADKDHNEDLFWAVRGGGGNFGIVTSFLYRAQPVSTVYGGPMFWKMEEAHEMLEYWQDIILHGQEDLYGFFGFGAVPPAPPFPEKYHNQRLPYIVWCYLGGVDKAEQVFKPIREHRAPVIDFVQPIPLPALNSMFDPLMPAGLRWYWQGDFFKQYSQEAIDLLIKHGSEVPTVLSNIHLYPINGAASRVGPHETAFAYRDANFSQVIVAVDSDPASDQMLMRWGKETHSDLHPYSAGGAYLNFKMDEGEDTVRAGYRDNYPRLQLIKAKYDPDNIFHINQNIKPKA